MASWASKHQLRYLGIVGAVFFVIAGLFIIPRLSSSTSCADGVQNKNERGIDCGGACALFCRDEVPLPDILWARAFPVTPGVYSAAALVVNTHPNAFFTEIKYKFRLTDRKGIFLGERIGTTFIPPRGEYVVFESDFQTGDSVPTLVSLTVLDVGSVVRVPEKTLKEYKLFADDIFVRERNGSTLVSATMRNAATFSITERFPVGVVVYSAEDNVVAVSETYLDPLLRKQAIPITFAWPRLFAEDASRILIYPRAPLLSVSF